MKEENRNDFVFNQDDFFSGLEDYIESPVDGILEEINSVKRGKPFPRPYDDKEKSATYIMQFPERFDKIWVLKPIDSLLNYSESFFYQNHIKISDHAFLPQNRKEKDRPYLWFLNDVFLGKEPLFDFLKVEVEQDVEGFSPTTYSLIDRIIADGDIHFCDLWKCPAFQGVVGEGKKTFVLTTRDLTLWLSFLKTVIPTRLVPEKKMPNVYLPRTKSRNDEDCSRTMETLGVYTFNKTTNRREIWISPKRIRDCANNNGINPEWLFVFVYLHELAHAALDPRVCVEEIEGYTDNTYCLKYDSEMAVLSSMHDAPEFVMEESLANMVMLQYIDWYSEIEEDYLNMSEEAIKFVDSQVDEYRFGHHQFDADVDWPKWRAYKSDNTETNEKIKAWYNRFFDDDGKIKGGVTYSREDFDKVFEK